MTELMAKAVQGEEVKKCPLGHVERHFTMAERQLIIFAAANAAKGGDYRKQRKLRDVRQILGADQVEEYFDRLREAEEEAHGEWARQRNLYSHYQSFKIGGMSREELLETFPNLKLDHPEDLPKKPPFSKPKSSREDLRGPSRTFFIPAKLEVFIEASLKDMQWGPADHEDVAELAEKYNLPDED